MTPIKLIERKPCFVHDSVPTAQCFGPGFPTPLNPSPLSCFPTTACAVSPVKEPVRREPTERELVQGLHWAGRLPKALASQQLSGQTRNMNQKYRD